MNTNCDITIRPAMPQDAAALLRIYAPYVTNTAITFEYDIPSVEEFSARIRQTIKRYPYLVAERCGVPIGYAYVGPFHIRPAYDWAVETSIYVDSNRRHSGIGRILHNALEHELKQRGFLNMYACISYPAQDDPYLDTNSVDFHQHMGYELVGHFHRCGYKFRRWYDMVYLEKILGKHTEQYGTPFAAQSVLKA